MNENNIQKLIMMEMSRNGVRIFRNNTGNGVAGSQMKRIEKDGPVMLNIGDWVVRHGSRIQYGLCVGSSDLIGWRPVLVTQSMVGQMIAQFVAAEIKSKTGTASDEQKNFINRVRADGGLSGILRSIDETIALLNPLNFDNQ